MCTHAAGSLREQGVNYMQASLLNFRNMTKDVLATIDTLARDIRLYCIELLFNDAVAGQ
jgi:hypothetical protein